MQLWTSIVSNPLLSNTALVLFLNKCDQLQAKLDSGMQFAKYIVSYGSRPNDFESTSNCTRFSAILVNTDITQRSEEKTFCDPQGSLPHAPAALHALHISDGEYDAYCEYRCLS